MMYWVFACTETSLLTSFGTETERHLAGSRIYRETQDTRRDILPAHGALLIEICFP